MLRNVKELRGYALLATDGVIGEVDDMYFDDEDWAVRYLVVDTGTWLPGRKVLISPLAIGVPDWMGQQLPVALTKARVKGSPDIDTRKPVSRQHETAYFGYYGYPYYWEGSGIWGLGMYPGTLTNQLRIDRTRKTKNASPGQPVDDCHLRSAHAVTGYHIHATDGDIGHLEDLLVDDQTWAIRYLIVNTSNWWSGHQVLVSPQWIEAISWSEATVSIDLTRQAVKDAPPYDPAAQLDRQQEQAFYAHYGRPGYWTTRAIPAAVEPSATSR